MSEKNLRRAVECHQRGDLGGAARCYREYLRKTPDDAERWHALGGIYYQQGELAASAQALERASALAPENLDYENDLAGLLLACGDFAQAEHRFRHLLSRRPEYAPLHYNLALALRHQYRDTEALTALDEAIRVAPEYAPAHYTAGLICLDLDQLLAALAAAERAVQLQPYLADAHHLLGRIYERLRHREQAEHSFRRACELNPDNLNYKINLAQALQEIGRTNEGIELLQAVLAGSPDSPAVLTALGQLLQNCGMLDQAEEVYRKALSIPAGGSAACLGLSRIRKFEETDRTLVDHMETMLTHKNTDNNDRINIHFSLGKIYDDLKDYEKAFTHYQNANTTQRGSVHYDRLKHENLVASLIETFTPEFFASRLDLGCQDRKPTPIFIVGMPRSGTTLTEQIVSSHPDVQGGGELTYFSNASKALDVLVGARDPYPQALRALDAGTARRLYQPYVELLRRHSALARFVTDKLPHNFLHLGFIRLLFPHAPIIHCQRDPLDVCLSIYFQPFTAGHDYAFDLIEIGEEYLRYHRLVQHWRKVLPGPYLETQYEDLVAHQEAKSRELIAFCGLEWNDACLSFYETRRDVKTASNWQVRQPIYSSSWKRWRNYEKYLSPLKELLGDILA